ncbi:MAG: hypothetical protein KJ709_07345 [Nanoarchaeota archaeon]|nr:hypothetical protein [Nanoarchaeota archaeon]
MAEDILAGMEAQLDEIETGLSYYKELSKKFPKDHEELERLVYKAEFIKEHVLRQLYLLRKHTTQVKDGRH